MGNTGQCFSSVCYHKQQISLRCNIIQVMPIYSILNMSAHQPWCFGGETLRFSMFWLRSLPKEKKTQQY